jgi:hypothetical protein
MMERVNSSMIYLLYRKNIGKCHNVPPPSITIKKLKKKTQKKSEKEKKKEVYSLVPSLLGHTVLP